MNHVLKEIGKTRVLWLFFMRVLHVFGIYILQYICVCVYMCIYIFIYRERFGVGCFLGGGLRGNKKRARHERTASSRRSVIHALVFGVYI